MSKQLAVVTGSLGFVGRHLTRHLADRGWSVVGVDRRKDTAIATAGVRQEHCDVATRRFARLMSAWSPDLVVHLAAQSSLAAMERDPAGAIHDNVLATAAVADACRQSGVGRLVFASSAAVYGQASILPTSEDAGLKPISAYGWSKVAGEQLVLRSAAEGGAPYTILRFGNLYGPGLERKDDPGVIVHWIDALIEGSPLQVRTNGRPTRDFVFIDDAVEAITAAANANLNGCFNISSGRETSLADLISLLARIAQRTPEQSPYQAPDGDIDRSVLNPAAANQALNWQSSTPLETGLAKTYQHLQTIHRDAQRMLAAPA